MKHPQQLTLFLVTLLLAMPVIADESLALIGHYQSDGHIKLIESVLQPTLADGREASEYGTQVIDDVVHIFRKGYDQQGACRIEMVALSDQHGSLLYATDNPAAEMQVFLARQLEPTQIRLCRDVGCVALGLPDLGDILEPGDNETLAGGRSDDGSNSGDYSCYSSFGEPCQCVGPSNEVYNQPGKCEFQIGTLSLNLSHWLSLQL